MAEVYAGVDQILNNNRHVDLLSKAVKFQTESPPIDSTGAVLQGGVMMPLKIKL